ncbi:hypothetical protein M2459_003221 [Parabacteroides sp. PF5-5]|uniref:DUF5119 domain-containing protein n=1 Tax=unclassified Parabacteroides TaxID=2649774 RepID=UPI00247677E7|nr:MULTISPECIES: DUF5119 domain-containing protein [unclassified Parabacteroides]MDH6306523.1 hypothetical protein [Parabacteroides sp. PH5-39]MDH6317490.1 hypothetical protein [Parabacteroides sp. PF5-13]MDH6321207.1 hypothetical protein [Parabacteroides sp. PH5-13]MDH6324939.1 hypothetical protein [Parabacteroides sp. PH5-8]MDH6328648.1 hypothetical protein [Parabacteroides sp. PH5-41]
MRNISIIYIFILLIGCLTTSCTRRSLLDEQHSHSGDALLKIKLNWKGSSKPQSMDFYFYNQKGGDPIYREGTVNGYEGYLPAATYDVVICNPDVVGVDIKDYQGYEVDLVEANTDAEDESCIEHVDNIYGAGLKGVVLPADSTVEKTAYPENLVKKLTVILRAETRKKVEHMQVNLSGAVLRKRIVDLVMSDETSNIKSDAIYDDREDSFKTGISTLGFRGKCPFNVHLMYDDNETVSCLPLDLTEVLVLFPEEEKTLEYTLFLPDSDEEIKMTIRVHQWTPGGGGEIIVQ